MPLVGDIRIAGDAANGPGLRVLDRIHPADVSGRDPTMAASINTLNV
jgi:hypothetical protein